MTPWRSALIDGGPRLDEEAHDGHVARSAVSEDHRLEEGRPAEVVDVVERGAGLDEDPHHLHVAEMRRGDEGRAVVGARDVARARAERRGRARSVATSSRTAAIVTTS